MSLKYRPEVDGLRAIAVCAVVLYHAEFTFMGINPFKGGYIGVDVFFVISGYLIASILLREMYEERFSFISFYERRARRILPALFTVMLASIPFAWIHMFPKAKLEYAGSILSSLAFSSNIWFWQEDSYWAESSSLKPFLHTWSLSVEEQFYLLFPIVLLLLVKFARGYVKKFFVLMFFISILLAHFYSTEYAKTTFYLLPTRAWEIFAGVLLASIERDKGRISHPFLDAIMPGVGLFLVCDAIIFFDNQTRHPSLITLIPVLGTMVLIWFCKKGEPVSDVLSSKPFVSIGIISYGFYLWHFPIFAFAKIKGSPSSQYDKVEWILLSLALSIVSYYLIEKPVRNRQRFKTKVFIPVISLPFLVLVTAMIFFYKTDGVEFSLGRFAELVETNYWSEEKHNRERFFTHFGCWLSDETYVQNDPFELCKSKEKLKDNGLVMVVGDSNVAAIVPGLIKLLGRDSVVQRIVNGCIPSPDSDNEVCNNSTKATMVEIKTLNPDLIVIGWRYHNYKDIGILKSLLENDLKPYRGKTLVFGPLPRWKHLPGQLRRMFEIDPPAFEVPSRLTPKSQTFQLENWIEGVAKEARFAYLSPVKTFCTDGACLVKVGSKPDDITTFDSEHLTHNASLFLVDKNIDLIKKYTNQPKLIKSEKN